MLVYLVFLLTNGFDKNNCVNSGAGEMRRRKGWNNFLSGSIFFAQLTVTFTMLIFAASNRAGLSAERLQVLYIFEHILSLAITLWVTAGNKAVHQRATGDSGQQVNDHWATNVLRSYFEPKRSPAVMVQTYGTNGF